MNDSWNLRNPDNKIVELFSSKLDISAMLSTFLVNRKVSNLVEADIFLNPNLDKLPNPFLLKGMTKTIDRIIAAIDSSEKIVVYGDFDCDGVTSTTILYSFLKSVDANIEFYIPERIEEGYGINFESIKNLAKNGTRLIISTDCGISENELVENCKELDLDFLITDHHTVPEIEPDSYSIVNPKQKGCEYPFKEICAAGVVFNIIMALRHKMREGGYFEFIE
ncbi:single-stranded-DNA-specific exonuclease RecJ, partial [bacterium]|nr:single-stranded-DNA-specific exonuclease RecJ [bacterium]